MDMNQNQNENQNQYEQSNERISTLHTRLQQEAEKIRKWKLQTELDTKQKVCTICMYMNSDYKLLKMCKSILDQLWSFSYMYE